MVAVSCLCLTLPAAAQPSGTIALQGNVGNTCSITVNQTAAQLVADLNLNLATSQTNLQIATSNERCNDNAGYIVTVTSSSAAKLASGSAQLIGSLAGNSDNIPYTLIYGTVTASFDQTGVAVLTNSNSKAVGGGINRTVAITYTGVTTLAADAYSDTLTFTILGKN